ncbi:sigma 54-interacting transcriptional regulator [Bacillus sp. CECT 9360]|uniref:sigma-54 interaction domain-containing protein n=1 Tax=Bacillus sp. CECT 9360 TaxID=2845821 RepID=UPI001E3AE878|nr:sigma 54-interacting transcriptional regulator [Bacillus sp. CECT 9360]CAH0346208.1 Anaerobic nitric oxide reductase transcription regulator NorR [Bacillus sp. CECT 9360]
MGKGIDILPIEWIKELIHLVAERLVVVDRDGIISYMDSAYLDFLGITDEQAIGRPVQEVIENSRMHIVAKTGIAELSAVQPIKGSEMIANRYPIYVKNQLVGAAGTVMFRNPQEWIEYSKRIQPLLEELQYYKKKLEKELQSKYKFTDLVGINPKFIEAKRLAERGSRSQSSILLIGESGTGKELFAHSIHQNSARSIFPFIRVNCASIPEHLLESELFGYESGAFTGAKKGGKKGKFEQGHMGTIFLDEIGDMPLPMQSKLLRVLQEKEIERIGGNTPKTVDVRIIAATHRDLEIMVEEGKFRKDLYYRLNVLKVEIPPLRERPEDILAVSKILLKKLERKFSIQEIQLSEVVIECLKHHSWPGNVRELENVLERALNILDGDIIQLEHLPLYMQDQEIYRIPGHMHLIKCPNLSLNEPVQPLRDIIASVEREAILKAIQQAEGNKVKAASILGIGKTSFYDKCKLHDIQ